MVSLGGKELKTILTLLFNLITEKDIIGLAETGSGKTGAFALPVLQALLENPQGLFALVLTPTRQESFNFLITTYSNYCINPFPPRGSPLTSKIV